MKGHVSTDDLDPVTARAVEILIAADVVAAEELLQHPTKATLWQRLLSRNLLAVIVFAALVLISLDQVRLTSIASSNHRLQQQIHSCVTPHGKCYERGQHSQSTAVADIVRVVIDVACDVKYPHQPVAQRRCIARTTSDLSVG